MADVDVERLRALSRRPCKPTEVQEVLDALPALLKERDEARAQLDAVERACSLVLLGSLPGRHGDRSIQLFHWKALGDAIRTAPKAPTTTPMEEPHD